MPGRNRGFTLIELLIVIAILAVLSVAVVLVLNPAELIRQGRDSTRLSDLAALNSAIGLYLVDSTSPNLGTLSNCSGAASSSPRYTFASSSAVFKGAHNGIASSSTSTVVTGTGWVDISFSNISAGSPLSREPMDPTNGNANFYAYACTGATKYELDAFMESAKYQSVEANDGGDNPNAYEIGSDLFQ